MGVVNKAEDIKLERSVALKFPPGDVAQDPQAISRFQREPKATSALNHPNICTIHEIDDQGGEAFIAMEFLDGHALKHRIISGPLPLDELLDIGIQMANALDAAHSKLGCRTLCRNALRTDGGCSMKTRKIFNSDE